MKTSTVLNAGENIFLISFLFQGSKGKYIFKSASDLLFILKNYDRNGIDKIKRFNHSNYKFEKISKLNILEFYSYDTELIEYLKNHYYFKK